MQVVANLRNGQYTLELEFCVSYQKKVNAELADAPDPAVLGEELDKLVLLEVEAGNKADDQQVVKKHVGKDNGSNDCVGQVKMKLKILIVAWSTIRNHLLTSSILLESKK